jgi:hypothetical protein
LLICNKKGADAAPFLFADNLPFEKGGRGRDLKYPLTPLFQRGKLDYEIK